MEKKFSKSNCEEFIKGFESLSIHSGFYGDQFGSVVPPITLSSTYKRDFQAFFQYSRAANPTRSIFEENIAALENGKHAIAFASGMAAISTVFSILNPGDHFLISDDCYGGTLVFLEHISGKKLSLQHTFVDTTDLESIKKEIKPNTKLMYLETPSNPVMKVSDIKAISEICKSNKIVLAVDNTFLSPVFQNPLSLGADIVIHSATKYIGGHSDLMMGILVVNDEAIYKNLYEFQVISGNESNPFDCYLAWRGLKTINVRMHKAQDNALKIAIALMKHEKVENVLYNGLPDNPGHELSKKQAKGFGAMLSFYLKEEKAEEFCKALTIFALAGSLGGVESLACFPLGYTHAWVSPELCKKLNINKKLVRMSIGIETAEDLIADINNALSKI